MMPTAYRFCGNPLCFIPQSPSATAPFRQGGLLRGDEGIGPYEK